MAKIHTIHSNDLYTNYVTMTGRNNLPIIQSTFPIREHKSYQSYIMKAP